MQWLTRFAAFVGTVLLAWGLLPWGTCALRDAAGVDIAQVGDFSDDSVSDDYDGRDRTPSSDVARASRTTGFFTRTFGAVTGYWGRYPFTRNPDFVVYGAAGGLGLAFALTGLRRAFGPGPKV